jgi:hypothetical protein
MGQTFQIMCSDCRVSLWVAQDHAARPRAFRIYGGNQAFPEAGAEDRYSPLAEFLFMHQRHTLGFKPTDAVTDDELSYLELEDTPGLPPEADSKQGDFREPGELERMKAHYAANAGRAVGDEQMVEFKEYPRVPCTNMGLPVGWEIKHEAGQWVVTDPDGAKTSFPDIFQATGFAWGK